MTAKKKVKKLPKPNTWQAIEHELMVQDAWGEQVVDPRIKERLRFGGNAEGIRKYVLWKWNKKFVYSDGNRRSFFNDCFFNNSYWNRDVRFLIDDSDDRYICRCFMGDSTDYLNPYFYMDRVI